MNNRQIIGSRIKSLREQKKLTQFALSEKTGIKHIARIEAGKYSAGCDLLCKIADALGVELFKTTDIC